MGRRALTLADLPEKYQIEARRQLQEGAGSLAGCLAKPLSTPIEGVDTPLTVKTGKKRMEMNQTEAEFSRILEKQRLEGKIIKWEYEALTLRHGVMNMIAYTPDFVTFDLIEVDDLTPGVPRISMRFIEVKGAHIREKDRLRFKAARNYFTMFRFELWQKTKAEGWQQIY